MGDNELNDAAPTRIVHHRQMPPTFEDVKQAAARLAGVANRTPVFTSRTANKQTGYELFFKAESLQRGGAFKFRGAYNAISHLSDADRARGVITYSSGNHAGAVALVASVFGVPAKVVMPKDAPAIKVAAVRGYGAEVVFYDRAQESREALARELADSSGATLVPPYDDPHIIAGAGTSALELFEEVGALDALIVPCGGGGLLSGSALSASALAPDCKVFGVEPDAGDDAMRSFAAGSIQTVHDPQTIADGARTPSIGELNFAIIRDKVAGFATVTDPQLVEAMRFLWERMKLVVEPTGALGAAAVFERKWDFKGQRVGVILSGGNVDLGSALKLMDAQG